MNALRFIVSLIIGYLLVAPDQALTQNLTKSEDTEGYYDRPGDKLELIKTTGKIRTIPGHKTIKVWLYNPDEVLKGKYQFVNDSTITVGNRTISLRDIQKISGLTWPSIFSPILIAGGGQAWGLVSF